MKIMKRKAKITRKTKETSISVDLNIDGNGKYKIKSGIGFFLDSLIFNNSWYLIFFKDLFILNLFLRLKS